MLYRKISTEIEAHLRSEDDKIMVVEGARQIGYTMNNVTYMPIYYIMCIKRAQVPEGNYYF